MPSPVSFPPSAFSEPPRRTLTPRRRWSIALGGALLGAIIGPSGFLLQMRLNTYRATGADLVSFPGSPERWGKNLQMIASTNGGLVFAICGFVATLALMPFLLGWLSGRANRPARSYYTGAALGGILFGAVATFLVAWMLSLAALIAGTISSANATFGENAAALLGGVFIFGPLVGMTMPFFFVLPIVGIGAPFGMLNAAIVRRLAHASASRNGM
jgi:hypothetical protein